MGTSHWIIQVCKHKSLPEGENRGRVKEGDVKVNTEVQVIKPWPKDYMHPLEAAKGNE